MGPRDGGPGKRLRSKAWRCPPRHIHVPMVNSLYQVLNTALRAK
jgi:hypothetical protein